MTRYARFAAALGVCACAAAAPTDAAGQGAPPADSARAHASSPLRPGDAVRLRVWREPDLSGEFVVDEGGVVNLPKVGPVRAVDEPIDVVKARIRSAYEKFLRDPSVEVTPLRRIRVAGAVRTPGLYTTDPTMTVADVLALAGGASPQGKANEVRLVRDGTTVKATLSQDTQLMQSPLRSGDQLYVPERGWISRNPGVVVGAVSAVATLIWALDRH
jgi:polysaccharide export outer membrane protein